MSLLFLSPEAKINKEEDELVMGAKPEFIVTREREIKKKN